MVRIAPINAFVFMALIACGGDSADPADATAEVTLCQRDDVETPEQAGPLPPEGATGQLCPVGDSDWYRVTMAAGQHLMRVSLAMDGDLSPVEPVYVVWALDGSGAATEVVAATPPASVGFPLDQVHCLAPGPYVVAVRDDGEDAEDFRRNYRLVVSSSIDPDPAEPNDDATAAVPIANEQPVTGSIACTGDTDWYRFEGGPGQVARLVLTMPVGGISPLLRLIDGDGALIATQVNPGGTARATNLVLEVVLPRSGRFYAVVSDDDGRNADPLTNYLLALSLLDDSDPNEPNGHPDLATPLAASAVACGADWSGYLEAEGTIGAPGDNDWFRVPLASCGGQGLIEAEVTLLTDGLSTEVRDALAREVQIALTLTRRAAGSPCSDDLGCQALDKVCDNDWDCSGLFNTCLPDGFCAGAGVCLPGDSCGADVIQRRYEPVAGAAAASQKALLTAPLFGDEFVYLRVADYQSDGAARDLRYRVRARVRAEPDKNEPSNVYAPTLLADFPVGIMTDAAKPIPVHDCTSDGVTVPDCCGPNTWVEGYLSYENDLDFYRYAHPCPGEDCNLRIVYDSASGPVDFVLSVYEGDGLWFGGVVGARSDMPTQTAMSGSFGGASSCFYAYAGHVGPNGGEVPFSYHVGIRDLATVRDASATQRYRFCIERTTRACEAPCKVYENGCGLP